MVDVASPHAMYQLYDAAYTQMMREIEEEVAASADSTGIQKLSPQVMRAFKEVPRTLFVSEKDKPHAYLNTSLSIGEGQTISQPFVVAIMTELLNSQPTDRVLEIGTGSGYQAAILSRLVAEVYTIEIRPTLAERVQNLCEFLGYSNIHVLTGDGAKGWKEYAPYDKIIMTAAAEMVPDALLEQVGASGRIVAPLGYRQDLQYVTVIEKKGERAFSEASMLPVSFVPFAQGEQKAL